MSSGVSGISRTCPPPPLVNASSRSFIAAQMQKARMGGREIPALPPPPTTRSRRFTRDITARARSSDDLGIAAVAPRMVG